MSPDTVAPHRDRTEADGALAGVCAAGIDVIDADTLRSYLMRAPDGSERLKVLGSVTPGLLPAAWRAVLGVYHEIESGEEYLSLCLRPPAYTEETLDIIDGIAERIAARLGDGGSEVLVTTDFQAA